MLRSLLLASCVALTLPVATRAQAGATDLASLIECRGDIAGLTALAPALEDPLKAVALGWQPLPQTNMFMTEYRLASPIRVFGHGTDHIAFTGSSVMAILDLPDPRPLASELGLETAIDTPTKAMFGKELRSEDSRDAESGQVLIESVILNVSNVSSHPGKTLVGCSYSLDLPEDAPDAGAPVPEGAPPPAPGGHPR